jgi:hypothetical protein
MNMDASLFDFVCSALERETELDRLAARGTVRLALKQAGLEAGAVSAEQMAVVLERVLPRELSARGVGDSAAVCARLRGGLAGRSFAAGAETPDEVFRRLGGDR